MPNVFEYNDYRKYLMEYYHAKKQATSWFSYNVFAQKIGFKNKGFLFNVLHGKKNLSANSVIKISQAMSHKKNESEYFENLVLFNQAVDLKEQTFFYERLNAVRCTDKSICKVQQLRKDQYEFYSTWYHGAIRSLIDMYPFKDDYQWLAKNVYPAITTKQAKNSIDLLEKLGLIERQNDGYYKLSNSNITTGSEIRNLALLNFYKEGAQLVERALDILPADKRNISGVTMGISRSLYDKICEEIKTFRKKVINMVQQDKDSDRAYQLNFHLFPITNTDIVKSKGPYVTP